MSPDKLTYSESQDDAGDEASLGGDQPDRVYADAEGPGEHDRALLDDDENDMVPCPVCAKHILAEAERCHHCGASFEQQAWNSGPVDDHYLDARQRQTAMIVVLVILGLLAAGGFLMWG